jgi:hypothetical protein
MFAIFLRDLHIQCDRRLEGRRDRRSALFSWGRVVGGSVIFHHDVSWKGRFILHALAGAAQL